MFHTHFRIIFELFILFDTFLFFVLMLIQILLWNALEMSNKLNKIWLKGLNPRISKDEKLNWSKFLK